MLKILFSFVYPKENITFAHDDKFSFRINAYKELIRKAKALWNVVGFLTTLNVEQSKIHIIIIFVSAETLR